LFLMITEPSRLPSVLLIVPFAAIFACLYFTIMALVHFFRSEESETVVGLKVRRPRLLAAVVAGFPVLLLVLQSIVQLTIWDVLITLIIFLLVYMYVSRSNVTFFNR
jgi:ABC-type spermidine/putrescine transport system permease subunit II